MNNAYLLTRFVPQAVPLPWTDKVACPFCHSVQTVNTIQNYRCPLCGMMFRKEIK